MMKMAFTRTATFALLFMGLSTSVVQAQETTEAEPDVVIATIEAPLSREALNAARLVMEAEGHSFNYGGFQFRSDGQLNGVEIRMTIDGTSTHEYVEFVTGTCVLQILKAQGLRMEGC